MSVLSLHESIFSDVNPEDFPRNIISEYAWYSVCKSFSSGHHAKFPRKKWQRFSFSAFVVVDKDGTGASAHRFTHI
jgi:hypothetical protein